MANERREQVPVTEGKTPLPPRAAPLGALQCNEVLAEWHNEHIRFAQLLDLMEEQLATFHEDGHPDYDLMRDIVCYLQDYADRVHHAREDAAFERLVRRDPSVCIIIMRVLQEHRVVATAGEELLRQLDGIAADVFFERAALEAAAATYLVYYRHHLRAEEADIMPHAAQILEPEDWAYVAAAVPTSLAVPLRGGQPVPPAFSH